MLNVSAGPSRGLKRGPKLDPNAAHNATIRAEADLLEAGGNTIVAGGGRLPEKLIPTPGGLKAVVGRIYYLGRRMDSFKDETWGGRTQLAIQLREREALIDLNQAGVPTDFVPYD